MATKIQNPLASFAHHFIFGGTGSVANRWGDLTLVWIVSLVLLALFILVALLFLQRFYVKATLDTALVRTGFGTNNVDSCARVCHSPTGYGLKQTFGTSAGTQDFKSVEQADVIMVIGANPTDAHPVFASRMKRRLREGADLIVVDPRSIDLVRSAHIEASHHLQLLPGTNVAIVNAMGHVVATEGWIDRTFVEERCDLESFRAWEEFIRLPENSPEALEDITGVPADQVRAAARAYATGGNGAIYYGLGVTEHSQGSTMVMAMANLAMATGNIGREGVGVNPLRGQNNVQGSCDMGALPDVYPGYQKVAKPENKLKFETAWDVSLSDQEGRPVGTDAALDICVAWPLDTGVRRSLQGETGSPASPLEKSEGSGTYGECFSIPGPPSPAPELSPSWDTMAARP